MPSREKEDKATRNRICQLPAKPRIVLNSEVNPRTVRTSPSPKEAHDAATRPD